MIIEKQDVQTPEILDLFPQTKKKGLRQKSRALKRKLGEVILGLRPFLKVHSEVLQTDFWFINEGLADPADQMFCGKVITMEMFAEIMAARQPILRTVEELFKEKV